MTTEPSPLSLRALAMAQDCVARGVRGGDPVRFAGTEVNQYLEWAGVTTPAPWCASAVGWIHAQAEEALFLDSDPTSPPPYNGCPRTASALSLARKAPASCRLDAPRRGAVFVLDRGHGRGHCGFVEVVGPLPGQVTTVEPDTNGAGRSDGDAWGRHSWSPAQAPEERGGTLIGWFDFGVAP